METKVGTVSLAELLKFFIKKWKMFLSIILVSTVLFSGIVAICYKVVVTESTVVYDFYSNELEKMNEYMENSVLMEIDATSISATTLTISNISDKDLLKNYVTSEAIWKNINDNIDEKYLTELVNWDEGEISGSGKLSVYHIDGQDSEKYANYLEDELLKYDPELVIIMEKGKTISDTQLLNEQLEKNTLYRHFQEEQRIAMPGYMENVTVVSAAVFGAFIGLVLSITVVILCFEKDKKI